MFSKLLIANRGEIACRIIRTARRLGLRTVAVYSEADAKARHVRLADEGICIGAAAASESYLRADRILEAARSSGAQAIHPGYGFLSENAGFARAVTAAGLVFIGPPATAIDAMGSKAAAKARMAKAGVPLVPGYHGDDQDPARLKTEADAIGYPLLIKASAGGGGKGMRIVSTASEFDAALDSCRREAAASFGDDRVLLERYLQRPRHIEVQVFADQQGKTVHLFERDCSVQRRHQKVLEEAPAPGLSAEQRRQMGGAAVAAARAVGYVGAGTVEFIAEDGCFYFMEMNTRLQVEHPVTEMVTGIDLVEWQLRIAAGEPLPLAQSALTCHGHAIEARLYAEDADRGFLPASGRLLHCDLPADSVHVRVDAGVEKGDAITPHYDPMIAKLIVWDEDRPRALARLRRALADTRLAGVTTNVDFLSRLAACPAFVEADLDTGLISRNEALLFPGEQPPVTEAWLVAALAEQMRAERRLNETARHSHDPWSPWAAADGWRSGLDGRARLRFCHGKSAQDLCLTRRPEGWDIRLGETHYLLQGSWIDADAGRLAVEIDGRRIAATVLPQGQRRHVFLQGQAVRLERDDPLHRVTAGSNTGGGFTAPMPGKVVALLATPGTSVEAGTPLLVLEAMKMEHTITAPTAGKLIAYRYAVGENVDESAALVDFESA